MPRMCKRTRRDARCVEIQYTLKVSNVQQRNFSTSLVISMDTLQAYAIKRNKLYSGQGNQKPICCKGELCMLMTSPYAAISEDCLSSNELFCLQVKIQWTQAECKKITTPSHLITNFTYKLEPHKTRNQYLRARLDTYADVNIMLARVYKLVFNDQELKKLAPSTLEIGTYATNTVKIVGSCPFYLVHLGTKKLKEVPFYVAQNDGSVFLS